MDLEYTKTSQKYSVSDMNNSKCPKPCPAWGESDVELDVSHWKFVDSDHVEVHCHPKAYYLLQNRFADGKFQPFDYKWILSMFISRKFKPV